MTRLFPRSRVWVWGLLALFVLVGSAALAFTNSYPDDAEAEANLRTLFDVVALVRAQYVDDVNTMSLISAYLEHGSVNEMLAEVLDDPYTRYLEPRAFEDVTAQSAGAFGGIGIMVGMVGDQLTIIAPIENTPGEKAGLRGGDRIMAVDGKSTVRMSSDEAVSLMRGEPDTVVVLLIERDVQDQTESFEVSIVRAIIETASVTYQTLIEPGDVFDFLEVPVGYVRLSNFSQRTDAELVKAITDLVNEQGVEGLVIDLRDNPGGVFEAALRVSNRFIREGPLVHFVGRHGTFQTFEANPQVWLGELPPIVILVNPYSASASEIFAGAMKDRGRAVVVGETTFGKGLVQTIIPISGGGALSLTTARYQTAGGNSIHDTGVEPDIVVEWSIDDQIEAWDTYGPPVDGVHPKDPQLRRGLEVLQQQIQQNLGAFSVSPAA